MEISHALASFLFWKGGADQTGKKQLTKFWKLGSPEGSAYLPAALVRIQTEPREDVGGSFTI